MAPDQSGNLNPQLVLTHQHKRELEPGDKCRHGVSWVGPGGAQSGGAETAAVADLAPVND